MSFFSSTVRYLVFLFQCFKRIFSLRVNISQVIQHMEAVGVRSFWIIIMAAIMIGAVFGLQFGNIFHLFGAESMVGAAASFAIAKELAPVIGAFLVTGQAGSAMAAEISTMRVNDQIDALKVTAVDPISYLIVPRIIASMLVMPLLSGCFLLAGVLASYLVSILIYDVDVGIFINNIKWITYPEHVVEGLQKAVFFGAVFSSVGCYHGFYALGGAKGVGESTTKAVVISLVIILISDFFISYWQMSEFL